MKNVSLYIPVLIMSLLMIYSHDSFAARYSIDVKDFEFSPSNLASVKIGDTIHWEWKNGSHTTTSTAIPNGAAAWDKPMDASNLTFDYIPTVIGTYHYKCTPHESMGMVGQFTVLSSNGIEGNSRIPKITLFPSPFYGGVNINADVQEGAFIQHLTIYGVNGQIIRDVSFEGNSAFNDYIDLSAVHSGLMVFEFIDNLNRSYILKAVKKD
jgi:plastocyanin